MKKRNDAILLAAFFTSLVLYVLILFFWDPPVYFYELWSVLYVSFHAVPAFCLQLWLCRRERFRWTRWLPLGLLALISLAGAAYLTGVVGSGWDILGGAVLLIGCLAPAAGCALGWIAAGGKLPRRLGAAGLAALLAVYLGLKYMGGPRPFFWEFELMDVPTLVILAAAVWLLLRGKGREKGKKQRDSFPFEGTLNT